MKRLLVVLGLVTAAFGQVTVTGTVQDTSGNLATSGYVEFDLIPQNQSQLYRVAGSTTVVPQKGKCGINTSGLVKNTALTNPCMVWGNDVITPGNTLYKVIIAPNNIAAAVIQNVLISGTTVNLASPTLISPQPVVGTVIDASPLITEGVQPAVDGVWNLGSPSFHYGNLYVNGISWTNCISCPGAVFSVFARSGDVTAQTGDYTVAQITGAAPLASPTFTGLVQGPSPAIPDNSLQFPTTSWVNTSITNALAPYALTSALSTYAPLASPIFSGIPTAPTAVLGTNTAQVATTAFVHANSTQTISSGQQALSNIAIGAGSCSIPIDITSASVIATDTVIWSWAPTGIPGANDSQLVINVGVSVGQVHVTQCNITAGGITPSGGMINWRVVR